MNIIMGYKSFRPLDVYLIVLVNGTFECNGLKNIEMNAFAKYSFYDLLEGKVKIPFEYFKFRDEYTIFVCADDSGWYPEGVDVAVGHPSVFPRVKLIDFLTENGAIF